MSKAIRTGKRTLAGVAAGALGLALIPFVATTSASAAPVSASATATATAAAVRPTGVSPSVLSIPRSKASWTGAANFADSNLNTVDLTIAPTASAIMTLDDTDASAAVTATLSANATGVDVTTGTDDSQIKFNVDTAGTYAGSIYNGTDTVGFSFTTAGAPTSMTLTPATQTVLVGAVGTVTVTLKDANGNTTQPQNADTVGVASNGDDTVAFAALTSTQLAYGVFDDTIATQTAGTSTITATPAGTLPGSGVTAQTATLVKSGTVSNVAIAGISVTTPANAANAGTQPTARTAKVAEGTTALVVAITDASANVAGTPLRFKAVLSAGGTVNGAAATAGAPQYFNLTTDALKQATLSLTIGGAGALAASVLTLTQVNVTNATVSSGGVEAITWQTPAVQASNIVPTPTSAVAAVGATTAVTVQVDDSFGVDQVGWTVRAYRTSVGAANLVGSGVTNASGSAAVTVSPLATTLNGQSETYVYTATPPVGVAVNGSISTTVSYTTSGAVSTMSVANGASATACSNTSCTLVTLPVSTVPSSGTVAASSSTGTKTVSTGVVTPGTLTSMMTFTPTTTPANLVTVTVPEGVKVSATVPVAGVTLWSAGAQTAIVSSGAAAYVWATATGTFDITFTSGGVTVTTKLVAINTSADAYNIALTPTSQDVVKGGIGSATLTVTDVFGNPVQTSTGSYLTDDTGVVALVATGELLLAGFNTNLVAATGVDGTVRVAFIAGNASGEGSITAFPLNATSASKTPAWAPAYIPPVGAPAPALTSVAEVKVGSGPVTTSMVIVGSRENRTIIVDGSTSGIAAGTTVRPWIKFPGETQYTQGAASRQIVAVGDLGAGEFQWQRQTSKKIYVYFRTEDGTQQSLRIIIPGR